MSPSPEPEKRTAAWRELVLTGRRLGLRLPDICARCGEGGARPLYWETVVLVPDSEGRTMRRAEGIRAPFCASCRALHEREVKRMGRLVSVMQCFRSEVMIGAVLAAGAGLFFGWKLAPRWAGDAWAMAVWAGVVGFFGLIALGCVSAAWRATRWRTVSALTSVTGSITWSEEATDLFEGERYRYTIRNDAFYDSLLALNQEKVWRPGGASARKAAGRRRVLHAAVGVAVVLAVFWEFFGEYLRREW